jgi:hypothetical protein
LKPLNRAIRTFIQAWAGSFGILLAASGLSPADFDVTDLSVLLKAGVGACFAGLIAVVALFQNTAEDSGVIPPLLKK